MRRSRGGIVITLGLTMAIAAGLYLVFSEKPIAVDTALVETAPMQVKITEEGMTRVREIYRIYAPITGQLSRTGLDEGDPVKAHETVLGSIYPLDPPMLDIRTEAELAALVDGAKIAVQLAEIELLRTRSDLELAERNFERATQLNSTGIVSDATLQKATADVEILRAKARSAEAAIDMRKAELASAQARLQPSVHDGPGKHRNDDAPAIAWDNGEAASAQDEPCCVNLISPTDGVVLTVTAESEQPVIIGEEIAELGDPNDLEVVVDLLSSDAVRIAPGTDVRLVDWGGEEALAAHVELIEPAAFTKVSALGIEEQRVNVLIALDDHDPRLGHGFRVFAEIVIWQSDAVLQVPVSALFRVANTWQVFTVVDGRARETTVEIGHRNDEVAEVLSGLEPGNAVILYPSDTIGDGVMVTARAQ